jgi:hypothetical protein
MTTQGIHSAIGDPREFLREEASFRKSCLFYNAHYHELLKQYPDEWIAIHDGSVRGHAIDLQQLLAQTDALGVPRSTTLFEILETNPRPRML